MRSRGPDRLAHQEGAVALNSPRPTARPSDQALHPWAWWCWALGLAATVSLTTNPITVGLIVLAATTVVLLRRGDSPWARSLGAYFALAATVLAIRLGFGIVMGVGIGTTVLFALPQIPLPDWAAGVRLGGPVTAEALAGTAYEALRLGAILICVGAANALANPKRALRNVPTALYEASVAVVIALSVAPALIESARRIRRAQRLRGNPARGLAGAIGLAVPVLSDAVERSISLAAGMEARGFGRTRAAVGLHGRIALTAGALAALVGAFVVLGAPGWEWAGIAGLVGGVLAVLLGLRRAGRWQSVTTYRPDPWGRPEWVVLAATAAGLAATIVLGQLNYPALNPTTDPLVWPELHPGILVVAALALTPLGVVPAPERRPDRAEPRAVPEQERVAA